MSVPNWTRSVENPYLQGVYAPTLDETHDGIVLDGEVPDDLEGAYVRNGPNPMVAPSNAYHWFDGDGMVHSVAFRDGKATYRSALIQTAGLRAEQKHGASLWPGVMGPYDVNQHPMLKDTANTDLVWHNGDLLALWYLCGTPIRLDPHKLTTRGAARRKMSAHPKHDERTGELIWFDLDDFEPPYMTYGVLDEKGELVHEVPIDLPGPRAPHDITITQSYSILHDWPLFHDPKLLKERGYRVTRFHRDLPSRLGVIPRRGGTRDIRWFEFAPGYALHMVNAWEDGDWIIVDGCFQPDPSIRRNPDEGPLASMLAYLRIRAHLHRWKMNLKTGETKEEALDDLNVEFCLPDTAKYGERTRYSYHQALPTDMYTVIFSGLVKYDHETFSRAHFAYPEGWYGSEAVFAPRPNGQSEDDGYVVSIASHRDGQSETWVFDATDIEAGPRARIRLPTRVPAGFHAKWLTRTQVFGS